MRVIRTYDGIDLTLCLALYQSLLQHHHALRSLRYEHQKLVEREKTLGEILNTLRSKYNPNYQDMGVLEAVRGWEQVEGLEHVNEVGKDKGKEKKEEEKKEEEKKDEKEDGKEEDKEEEDKWTKERLERELDGLLRTDHVSLLLQHDEHVAEVEGSGDGGCKNDGQRCFFNLASAWH